MSLFFKYSLLVRLKETVINVPKESEASSNVSTGPELIYRDISVLSSFKGEGIQS